MRKMPVFGGLAVVIVAGVFAAAWVLWPGYQMRHKVKALLPDPESAQFSDVTTNPRNGVTCGLVNAKNRAGGFSKTIFVLFPNGDVRMQPSDDATPEQASDFKTLVASNCQRS